MAGRKEPKRRVTVFVGDKTIPLNPFTQDIVAEINLAMIKSLKKVTETEVDNVQIKISIDPLS